MQSMRTTPYGLVKRFDNLNSNPIRTSWSSFSTHAALRSGHNKWSKIKHDKAKEDAGKSKQRSALTSEIRTIAKLHGADPATNPRLAALVAIAKKSGLPKATLDGAIARGAGKSLSGAPLETITIEAMLPSSVAAIIECQTDSRLRTLQDIRYIITHSGGTVTPTNHLFERVGKIVLQVGEGIKEEDIFDYAIEAGATDVKSSGDGDVTVFTEPQQTASTADALAKMSRLEVLSSDIVWSPKEDTRVESPNSNALGELVEKLEEDPSVQSIYLNLD